MNVELELRTRTGKTIVTLKGNVAETVLGIVQKQTDVFKKETKNFKKGGYMTCYTCRITSFVKMTDLITINVEPYDYFIVSI